MSTGFILGTLGLFTFFTVITFGSAYLFKAGQKQKAKEATANK